MNVVVELQSYIEDNELFTLEDRLLVAVSGGKDSMLLLWMLMKLGYSVEIAHCNFQLRGEESDKDEALVRDFAIQNNIPFHVMRFDTLAYTNENKVSIQIAARKLRYKWFGEKAMEVGAKYIAVAQHKNDHVETVLLNLVRGTGLLGLQGILASRTDNNIVRPLLWMSRKEIDESVQKYEIPFRDDASNFSNKYARNKVRLDIVPEFEKLNPEFIQTMGDNITRFQEANQLLKEFIDDLRERVFTPLSPDSWSINKVVVNQFDLVKLYYLFEPFGFHKFVLEDLKMSISRESGRTFESLSHQILLDRDTLILEKKVAVIADKVIWEGDKSSNWGNYSFLVSKTDDKSILKDQNIALFDSKKIVFPLLLRCWHEGDVFQPLGMKGKKKISDLFIQKKVNVFDKKKIPLLVNGNGDILWVVGIQVDDRYKITENTQKVLKLVNSK